MNLKIMAVATLPKIISYMTEWVIHYVKNKDILDKNILSIDKTPDGLCIKFKKGEQFYLILPTITNIDAIVQKIKERKNLTLVVLNSRDNFQLIAQYWKRFIDYEQFNILFINPFSKLDKRWIINPYIHNKICDSTSLVAGLRSIFSTVEPITEEQLQRLISNT